MRITVSVNGRFHAFDLAKQLQRRQSLLCLFTTYPKFKALEWGINGHRIRSLLSCELVKRSRRRCTRRWHDAITVFQKEWFDKRVARNIPEETDIFVGWSSNCLHSIRHAKQIGIRTILQRGSSHMITQQKILAEEYDKYGIKTKPTPSFIVEKELQEYREADYIEVPSSFAYESFLDQGITEEKMIRGFRGVDLSHFQQIKKEESIFRIIYAGMLSIQKGSHYLLQAINELRLPNCEFWHLGKISAEMVDFIKKYKTKNIIFKGHRPQNELYRYYSQGSVFVMPSIHDGFGMVINQAMACGLPVVCTENTGGPDVIEDGKEGFIVPIRDVEALKERILYLYENQGICREMGKMAKLKVSSAFTWDDYGEKVATAYEGILNAER